MEIKDILDSLLGGGAGAIVVGGLLKMMIQKRLDQMDDHEKRLVKVEREMATKTDLSDTAENLADLILEESRGVTTGIYNLFASLRRGK